MSEAEFEAAKDKVEELENGCDDNDEYNEDEDEDFDPTKFGDKDGVDDEDEEEEEEGKALKKVNNNKKKSRKVSDEYDEVEVQKDISRAGYDKIESSEGGLIKTRTQRAKEEQNAGKQFKTISQEQDSKLNINSIWNDLKTESSLKITKSSSPIEEDNINLNLSGDKQDFQKQEPEKIKIKTSYEFAGDIITEDKWVDASSAEAQAYLNSTKLKSTSLETPIQSRNQNQLKDSPASISGGPQRKSFKRKRPSLLDAVINDSKASKLSTLEKSRLDWSSYVDKHNIKDELKTNKKGGYLDKQDFLSRVERNLDDKYKASKKKL
ncbi:hypothetical protein PACTADRAFT_51934 [Pachysolen tannophilus NRRL Y-2460]|uniref:SWR1-complex protein 5 n=1 Tax=Pachysolen tannophilus NRRL Y-2460 TaxID=669874 RepID=A0A1E4TNN7_PACTA|nr:hypothetical protein PACTADRAFT_51934 [Pachysolen tannophilus NRRL Y-2460]